MFRLFILCMTISQLSITGFILNAQTTSFPQPYQINSQFKLSSDSVQVAWIRQYISGYEPAFDYSNAIVADESGNVYITGGSYGSNELPDIVTIKYNNSGDTIWVRRYNGPGNNWDIGRAIVLDESGNVYVTGETYSDSTYFNFVTIKYNSEGIQQWIAYYDGLSNNDDGAIAIAVDKSGNVYVTGHSYEFSTSWDYLTVKYNSSGQQQWIANYNGLGNTGDFAIGIATDSSGNVYVTGSSDETTFDVYPAYATIKYNTDGVEQWAARYSELWSYATDIAVDASGNVYVTGYSYALGAYYDYTTIKYNTTGIPQWISRYNGPGGSDDYAKALTIDDSGNVFVTGEAFFVVNEGSDYATIKYNPSGIEQWVARYNGSGNSVDVANAIVLDDNRNIYVTGESRGTSSEDDFATIKYDQMGNERWVVRYNGLENSFDLASDLDIDESGNVYVTGRSSDVGYSIYTTIKYVQDFVSAQETDEGEIREFTLEQNFPNPFNPSTRLPYAIGSRQFVTLKVYDLLGREVATLVNEEKFPGEYEVEFNAVSHSGEARNLPSGVYFYQLKAGNFIETKKMLLLK